MTPLVDRLLADPVPVHGDTGDPLLYGLNAAALRFIEGHVGPGDTTVETGSGYSTILLASLGARHTCIVPSQTQVDRIRSYCGDRGLGLDAVSFEVECSEYVLPRLTLDDLSFVLIDGSHAFPQVFIDYFYTAEAIRPGGHLMVDDVHLWTGKTLRRFLREDGPWREHGLLDGRTAVFEKIACVDVGRDWVDQPFVARRSRRDVVAKARIPIALARQGRLREIAILARRQLRGR